MNAGRMRHWVEVQAGTVSRDAGGGAASTTWTTITDGARWAEVRPASSSERYDGQQLQELVTHEIRTRYLSGITIKHRVLFGARLFDIQSVINWGERNSELMLRCIERMAV